MICFSLILKLEKNPNIDLADMHGIPLKLKSYWELRIVGIGSQYSLTVWSLTHRLLASTWPLAQECKQRIQAVPNGIPVLKRTGKGHNVG